MYVSMGVFCVFFKYQKIIDVGFVAATYLPKLSK